MADLLLVTAVSGFKKDFSFFPLKYLSFTSAAFFTVPTSTRASQKKFLKYSIKYMFLLNFRLQL